MISVRTEGLFINTSLGAASGRGDAPPAALVGWTYPYNNLNLGIGARTSTTAERDTGYTTGSGGLTPPGSHSKLEL